jgi:hypothetical protein
VDNNFRSLSEKTIKVIFIILKASISIIGVLVEMPVSFCPNNNIFVTKSYRNWNELLCLEPKKQLCFKNLFSVQHFTSLS